MRARLLSLAIFAFAAVVAIATSCGYDPQPASGMLQCGPQSSCPENYSCMSGHCYRNGGGASSGSAGSMGSAGHGGTSGGGGTGGSSATDKFIGTWSFANPSSRMIVCTDGFTENKAWDNLGEQFDVMVGPMTTPLATFYYCDWDLDVSPTGTSTVIKAGESCSAPDPNAAGTMYTWHGQAFTLTTTNGRDGTLAADLPYDFVTPTGTGTCTMHFTGTMRKN